jgi:Rrf2 family protein
MAVHVLVVLAYKEGDRITSSLLACSVNTNPVIIRRLLLALQRSGLIETRKGAGLGSRLSRSPARIHLADVYRAVEAQEAFAMPRGKPDPACPVGHCIRSVLQRVFHSAEQSLLKDLEQRSLADIVEMVRGSCGQASGRRAPASYGTGGSSRRGRRLLHAGARVPPRP